MNDCFEILNNLNMKIEKMIEISNLSNTKKSTTILTFQLQSTLLSIRE
jgi:hypothetical protein